jgi:hypothetical protein
VGGDAVVVDEVDGPQRTLQAVLHFFHFLVDGEAVLLPLLLSVAQLLDQELALLALGLGALQQFDGRLGGGWMGSVLKWRLLLGWWLLCDGLLEVAIGQLGICKFGDELCVLLYGISELVGETLVIGLLFFYEVLEDFPLLLETCVLLVPKLPLLCQSAPPAPHLFLQLPRLLLHLIYLLLQGFNFLQKFLLFLAGMCA